jgi:nitroimidazol reductase NimA-like FMN-containing flavoprotein (pyridoxamine 5'-phosphate oxidase superfamily)
MTLATIRPDGFPQATILAYAYDGFTIYFACDRSSQKVRNLRKSDKVSVTIDGKYDFEWNHLNALSMGAVAEVLSDAEEIQQAYELLAKRFKTMAGMSEEDIATTAFIKVTPKIISVLNYDLGFGHTELVRVNRDDLSERWPIRRAA